ncbi:hypothetical protein CRE_25872 [Caenorhabditis remanei]|uniref:Retrotransposon gag domain-containing protein n=1 Tax=Caenorhabditis remanei TaxID=31234 RepID=E3NDS1_CAERE|nr:hypothetical protein CRE_25872 [Caenorhabditis remanei]
MCYKATDPTSDMTLGKITSVEKCKVKKQRPHDTRSRTKIEETQMEPTRNRLIPPLETNIVATTRANQSANHRCQHHLRLATTLVATIVPPLSPQLAPPPPTITPGQHPPEGLTKAKVKEEEELRRKEELRRGRRVKKIEEQGRKSEQEEKSEEEVKKKKSEGSRKEDEKKDFAKFNKKITEGHQEGEESEREDSKSERYWSNKKSPKLPPKKKNPRDPTSTSDRILRSQVKARDQEEEDNVTTTSEEASTIVQRTTPERSRPTVRTPITARTPTTVRTPRGFWNFLSDILDQSIPARTPRSSTPTPGHQSPRLEQAFPDLKIFGEKETEEGDTLIAPQFYTPNMSLQNGELAGPPTTEQAPTRNELPTWKRKGELTKMLDPRIKKFAEGRSSDLHKWLKEYAKLLFRMDIPRETGTELLPFFLSGTALQKYNALDNKVLKDWEKMTKQLMLAHDCPTDREISLQELTSVQQGKKTVSDFSAHIRELGEYVYEGLPEKNRELLLASHFLTGCNKKIKSRIRQLQNIPKSLRAMTAEAEKIQRLLELEEEEEATEAVIAAVQNMNWNNTNHGFQPRGNFQGYDSRGGYRGRFNQNEYQPRGNRPFRGGYQGRGRGNWNQGSWNGRNENPEGWNQRSESQGNWNQGNGSLQQSKEESYNPNPAGQGSSNQAPQNTQDNRRIGWDTNTGRPYIINSISKTCLGIMMCLFLIGNTEATKQICGFGEAGNIFIPPTATPCNFDRSLPLQTYAVNVYRQRIKAIQMEANKCFKHEVEGEVYSFLKIYKTTEAKIGKRVPISVEECRKTAITKKFNDMELKEIAPGIYRSEKISEAAENATRILGTTTFKTFEFTMEVGQVASLDGIHALSTLGSLEKCTFGSGSCQDDSSTIVWQPQETRRECQFELIQSSTAIISQQFIAIEEMAIFSKFDTDLRRLQEALEGCFIHQGYRTDDGYLIEFPEVHSKGWVPDMHIDAQTFGGYHNPWFRRTRETVTSLGPAGTEFRAYIGEPFITPLIRRLYGTANIEELTDLKSPITDPEILQEFGKYNVTNKLLADRARFYPKDRKHLNPMLIIALKAIRVAQYGVRQKKAMEQLKRPLTRGEEQLKLEIERKVAVTFDKLLEKEFGRSDPDVRNIDDKFEPPRFDEDKLAPYRNLPVEEEASWTTTPVPTTTQPTTTIPRSTQPPTTTPRNTQAPMTTTESTKPPRTTPPNTPPPETTPKPRSKPRPTTTRSPPRTTTMSRRPTTTADRWEYEDMQQSEERETPHIPEANRKVVYEPIDQQTFEESEYRPSEERERPMFERFEASCQEQWKSTTLFQTLLRIDPTAAIRQLLRRNDISAKIIGESLIISKCRQVTPDVIHYGQKVNSTCYNLIPVTVKGKLWFQLPGSDDLIGEATEIACEDRPPSVRYEHNRWVGLDNPEVLPQFLADQMGSYRTFILPAPETFHTSLTRIGVFYRNRRECRTSRRTPRN